VFVLADPSIGIESTQRITDTDSFAGVVTGSHEAPVFRSTAAANQRTNQIALMNPDGSGIVNLHVFGSDPALSPDGKKIAFCSLRESQYSQIYVMNVDGSEPKRLTNYDAGDACGPAWSHDGKRIAYYAFAQHDPRRNPEIWVMEAGGANPKRL